MTGKPKVYIDGREGTTGLQIYDRLRERGDLELLLIDEDKRKDPEERKKYLNAADIVFLCLPDGAAREAVSMVENEAVRIIDASTAHRTAPGWAYGLPELSAAHREAIRQSKRTANPGCHATGFIAAVYPLTARKILDPGETVTCFSLTGYSGGGKKMIAEYEASERDVRLDSPRIYGLNLKHKHLPEMRAVCGLARDPIFCPVVADYYKGMAVTVCLSERQTGGLGAEQIREELAAWYRGQTLVDVAPFGAGGPMIAGNEMAGLDNLTLYVNGREDQVIITALFDNLGKGASGAAVQNMNLMLGFEETAGLALPGKKE